MAHVATKTFLKSLIGSLGAAVGAAALFAVYVWRYPYLVDMDAWYHAGMAKLIFAHGVVRDFPWMTSTIISNANFIDHHFLYHVLLAPFVGLLPDMWGMYVFQVIMVGLFSLVLGLLFVRMRVQAAWFWVLVFITGSPLFLFRLGLGRTLAVSLVFLFVGWLLLTLRSSWRNLALFAVLGFATTWLYNGFFLLLVLWGWAILWGGVQNTPMVFKERLRWLGSLVVGSVAGILTFPYFPASVKFWYTHVFRVALFPPQVPQGGEWSPTTWFAAITDSPLLWFLLVGVLTWQLCLFLFANKKILWVRERLRLFVVWGVPLIGVFALMLAHNRMVDFFVPLLVIVLALLARAPLAYVTSLARPWFLVVCATILLVLSFSVAVWKWHDAGFIVNRQAIEQVAVWQKANIPAGEIVFHARWDQFPMLWYFDNTHRYIAGLDTVYFYFWNPEKYAEHQRLVTAGVSLDEVPGILQDFHASWIFTDSADGAFRSVLDTDPRAVVRYTDTVGGIVIYEYQP